MNEAKVPTALEQLVDRLLAKDPAQWPGSAAEVCERLEEMDDHHADTPLPSRGPDVTSTVELTPQEAAHGAVLPTRMTSHRPCPALGAVGLLDGRY